MSCTFFRNCWLLLMLFVFSSLLFAAEVPVERKAGDEMTNPVDGATMVWVPGGSFTMGSPDGVGRIHERPERKVTLTGYWLYKYEVTVAQYLAFCTATRRTLPPFTNGYSWRGTRGWYDLTLQQHPIVQVSWHDAQAYASWAKVALPTEAQWEYAARGPEGRNYPWGGMATVETVADGWDSAMCANHMNSFAHDISTWLVGSFPAGVSWSGAHDMAGNVWEWCADWYGPYSTTPAPDPTGPATGTQRVLRGGSWISTSVNEYRSAYRRSNFPDDWVRNDGFRCVSHAPGG